MGTTLTGKRVQNTYDSLLKLSDNDNLTSTPKIVGDGLGNDSPIYLSETKIGIGVSPTFQFQTSDAAKIGGNLTVAGNLTVNGSTTIIDSTVIAIGDNMMEMAKDNVSNTMDIGWYGTINDGTEKYVGVFYDASTGTTNPTFRIGLGTTEPSSTASWTTKGKLIIGALDAATGTFSGDINANSGIVHLTSDAPILRATSNNNASGFRIQVYGLDGDGDDLFRVQDESTTKFNLKRDGDAIFTGDITLPVAKSLYFGGGSHTYIREDIDDRLRFFVGGTEFMRFTEDTSDIINFYKDAIFAGKIIAQQGIQITGGSIAQSTAVLHTNNVLYLRGGSNGLFLQNADGSDGYYISNSDHKWEVNSSTEMRLNSTGLGLNGSTPAYTIDTGETTVGTLRMVGDADHTFIRLGAGGGGNDVTIIRIDGDSTDAKHDGETDLGAYGFSLKYLGSLSGNENALALYADNSAAASQVESFRVKQDGTLDMGGSSIFTQFIKSNSSFRIDIDNDNNQTDRIFIVSKHNSGTELFRVQENGSVGIGTNDLGTEAKLAIAATNANEGGQIVLHKGTDGTHAAHLDAYHSTNDYLRILKGTNTATSAAPFYFDLTNDRLGIGTVPSSTLHVDGNATFTGHGLFQGSTGNAPTGSGTFVGLTNDYANLQLNGTNGSHIDFSKTEVDYKGRIIYFNSNNSFIIYTDATQALTIDGSQKATFKADVDIDGNLQVDGTIKDSDGDAGTSGQLLSSTGSGTNWIDFEADVAKRIDVTVKNVSGGSLAKGVVVHAAPTTNPPEGNVIEVIAADANDAAKMPAIGVLNETIADEAEGEAVMFGAVSGIDTSSFSIGDELYVSTTAGEFTATKPTAFGSQVQKVAVVIKSHASNGLIKVFGAGRSNDVPNRVDRNVNFTDSSVLSFGTSTDLEIYHDGTNSVINNKTGDLQIYNNADDKDIVFISDNGSGGTIEYFRVDGSTNTVPFGRSPHIVDNVKLYFGNDTANDASIKWDSTASQLFIEGTSKFLDDLTVLKGLDVTHTESDVAFFRSSEATTTNVYITNTNATANNTANLYFAPANNIAGSYIKSTAVEDFSESAKRTSDLRLAVRKDGTFNEAIIINSSGSIGVGTHAFAHGLGTSVNIDLLGNGGIWGYAGGTYVNSNAYYDASGWKYKSNGTAAALLVGGSSQVLTFRQASSGTADATITYTEAFRVHSNGNLGINESAPVTKLHIKSSSFNDHITLSRGTDELGISVSGGQILVEGGLSPFGNDAEDLGRSDKYWRNIYANNIISDGGNAEFQKVYKDTVTINNSTYTTIATVGGNTLASGVRLNVTGTSGSVVINVDAKILVQHHKDILIQSTSGYYRKIFIKVISDNNEDFAIQLKRDTGGSTTTTDVNVEIIPLSTEVITFTSSHSFTGQSHEHITEYGETWSSADGDNANDFNLWLKDDGAKLKLGAGQDLQLWHDGTNNVIRSYTGDFYIQAANSVRLTNNGASEHYAKFFENGAVELMYDNSKKLQTETTGVGIVGDADVSGTVFVGNNNSLFAENNLRFKSAGAAYIDHNTVGQSFVFRTSDVSTLDTTAMVIEDNGSIEMSGYGTEGAYLKSKGSFRIDIDNDNDHTDRSFIISSNGAASDLVTVKENGSVGINTTSPASTVKLQVNNTSLGEFAGGNSSNAGGSHLILMAEGDTARNLMSGPSIVFKTPANSDGSNIWATSRILGSPAAAGSARGTISLQVRDLYDPLSDGTSWNWRTALTAINSGRVGINTNSPVRTLHVEHADDIVALFKSTDDKGVIQISDNDTSGYISSQNSRFALGLYVGAHNENLNFYGDKLGFGTATPTHRVHIATPTDNTYALRIQGSTNNNAGQWTGIGIGGESANTKSAIIFEDIGQSYSRGKLHFCINNETNQVNASPSNAAMTISNDSKVGIGVTNPSDYYATANDLVVGGASTHHGITIATGTTSTGALHFADGTSGTAEYAGYIGYQHNDNRMRFGVNASDKLVILSDGRVGINQTNPADKLEVYNGSYSVIIGGPSFSWVGNSAYPTIYGSNQDRWVMITSPHIPYLENGVSGYAGNTSGARIRFASKSGASSVVSWDAGVPHYGGTDTFTIGRDSTALVQVNSSGYMGIGGAPSHKLHIKQNTAAHLVNLIEQDNASYEAWYEAKSQNSGYARFGISTDANAYAFFNTSVTSYNWYHTGGGLLMTLNSNGHLGLGITNLTFAKLAVNGATYSSGGTFNAGTDTVTDAAFVLDEGDYIYTRDSSQYARKLIGKNTSDIITIGQSGTSLIDGIDFYSGSDGANYRWFRNTSVAMQLYGSGSQPYEILDVKGRIQAETDNGNVALISRAINISYQGATGTYDFDPVALFGANKQGGYVLLEVTGWQTRFNSGYIHWRNNGGTGTIGSGGVTYRQTAWSGSSSGAGVTVSTISSSTNVIRISFSGWHSNSHGWKATLIWRG